jgi:hypothetical protein
MSELTDQAVNVTFRAEGPVGLLSNLAHTPFVFRGIPVASAEGLIQGLKEEKPVRQGRIFQLFGYEAQRASSDRRNARVQEAGCVWFNGAKIAFPSEEYFASIEEAIQGKFRQNPEALAALVATRGARLVHDTGKKQRSGSALPGERFIAILERIRDSA